MIPHDAGYPDPTQPPSGGDLPAVAGRFPGLPGEPPEGVAAPGLAGSPGPWELLRSLRRRWVSAVLLGGVLAALAAAGTWFLLAPNHTAFTRLLVKYQEEQIFGEAGGTNRNEFGTYLRTKASQIMSRPVIWSALKQDDVKRLRLEDRHDDPVAFVEEHLRVEFQDTNEVMSIYVDSPDPYEATTLAKAITSSFMDTIVYAEDRARVRRVNELERVYTDAADGLKTKKDNLRKLAKTLGASDPFTLAQKRFQLNEGIRDVRQQRNRIGMEYLKAQADLEAFDAKMQAVRDADVAEAATQNALAADPDVQELRKRIDSLEETIADYVGRGASPAMPTLVVARERVAGLKRQLADREKEVRAGVKQRLETGTDQIDKVARAQLANRVTSLKDLHDDLKKQLDTLVDEANDLVTQTIPEHEALRDEITRQEEVVNEIGHRLEKERVDLRSAARIDLYQDADLQPQDIKKQVLATAGAPVLVLVAVCLGLAWFEYRQRRVRSAGEVARGLGIRVVGAVPALPNLERHVAGSMSELELDGQTVLESVDAIRTLLLRDAHARGTRVVMVTSATAGEGKTTLAGHMARSLARAGRKTLLVDADLRNPAAHELFDVPLQPGFSEVLLGEVEVADAVQPAGQPELAVMTAGQWDREVLQALARGGLEAVIDKLRQEFDFVVIDSHPVLHATDSLLIGQQADAVLLSVLREVSQAPRVYVAAGRLTSLGIRVLGAVVNGTDPEEVIAPPPPVPAAA